MHKLFILSRDAHLHHPNHIVLTDVAVYDRSLLTKFLMGVSLRGDVKACANAKRAIEMFLGFWEAGENRISIRVNGFDLDVYPTDYIEKTPLLIELGNRPANHYRDILTCVGELSTAMSRDSGDAAEKYAALQKLLERHPHLPAIKGKA